MQDSTHIHIFYTDPANGWAVMKLDANDCQVGGAHYYYLKSDALTAARMANLPVHVFGKNGLFQRTA